MTISIMVQITWAQSKMAQSDPPHYNAKHCDTNHNGTQNIETQHNSIYTLQSVALLIIKLSVVAKRH
jgi:hypothetical protein